MRGRDPEKERRSKRDGKTERRVIERGRRDRLREGARERRNEGEG